MKENPGNEKKHPKDLGEQMRRDPEGTLGEIQARGLAGFLEQRERLGQMAFVNSEDLPVQMNPKARLALEKAGVKFPQSVKREALFQRVQLPKGWKKVATNHEMWSNLLDSDGRVRAIIFYKASYGGESFLSHKLRLDYNVVEEGESGFKGVVRDGENILHETPIIGWVREWAREKAHEEAANRAKELLNKFYPNWEDESAYWDEEIKPDINPDERKEIVIPVKKSFPVIVDYDETLEELKNNPFYPYFYKRLTYLRYFPQTERKGKRNIEVYLVQLCLGEEKEEGITAETAVKRLREESLRPAELRELLAFKIQHNEFPNSQIRSIIALGQGCIDDKYPSLELFPVMYDNRLIFDDEDPLKQGATRLELRLAKVQGAKEYGKWLWFAAVPLDENETRL